MSLAKNIRKLATVGERYGPAMKIEDPKEAERYFEALVTWRVRYCGESWPTATLTVRQDLLSYAFNVGCCGKVREVFNLGG